MAAPDTRYFPSGGFQIAYQVAEGDGPRSVSQTAAPTR
jgi:hypothetical protein